VKQKLHRNLLRAPNEDDFGDSLEVDFDALTVAKAKRQTNERKRSHDLHVAGKLSAPKLVLYEFSSYRSRQRLVRRIEWRNRRYHRLTNSRLTISAR